MQINYHPIIGVSNAKQHLHASKQKGKSQFSHSSPKANMKASQTQNHSPTNQMANGLIKEREYFNEEFSRGTGQQNLQLLKLISQKQEQESTSNLLPHQVSQKNLEQNIQQQTDLQAIPSTNVFRNLLANAFNSNNVSKNNQEGSNVQSRELSNELISANIGGFADSASSSKLLQVHKFKSEVVHQIKVLPPNQLAQKDKQGYNKAGTQEQTGSDETEAVQKQNNQVKKKSYQQKLQNKSFLNQTSTNLIQDSKNNSELDIVSPTKIFNKAFSSNQGRLHPHSKNKSDAKLLISEDIKISRSKNGGQKIKKQMSSFTQVKTSPISKGKNVVDGEGMFRQDKSQTQLLKDNPNSSSALINPKGELYSSNQEIESFNMGGEGFKASEGGHILNLIINPQSSKSALVQSLSQTTAPPKAEANRSGFSSKNILQKKLSLNSKNSQNQQASQQLKQLTQMKQKINKVSTSQLEIEVGLGQGLDLNQTDEQISGSVISPISKESTGQISNLYKKATQENFKLVTPSALNLPPIQKDSQRNHPQQLPQQLNLLSPQNMNSSNNDATQIDPKSKKMLQKSLGQLSQLVYSPYQIDDNSTSQYVLSQIVQEEFRTKLKSKKRYHTRQASKIHEGNQLMSQDGLKSQIDNLKTTFVNRKASQIQQFQLQSTTFQQKDPAPPLEPLSASSTTKQQYAKKFDFSNGTFLQFSPYMDGKSKAKLEHYQQMMNHTQTTGFGQSEFSALQTFKSKQHNGNLASNMPITNYNMFTVHPLSSAGSSGTNFNHMKSIAPMSSTQMSQADYVRELETKLAMANERIALMQSKKRSSGKLYQFGASPNKKLTQRISMDGNSLSAIDQFYQQNRVNASFMDDGTKTTERNNSKQFAEPEAEDRGEEFRNPNLELIKESRNNSVSNDETHMSYDNSVLLKNAPKKLIEVQTQTKDSVQMQDVEIQVNFVSSSRRQHNSILHQLSTLREHGKQEHMSFESARQSPDIHSQPSKEEDLHYQVSVMSQHIEYLKEQVLKKDRDMRIYYDQILIQRHKYESDINILKSQQEVLEAQLIKYMSGNMNNGITTQNSQRTNNIMTLSSNQTQRTKQTRTLSKVDTNRGEKPKTQTLKLNQSNALLAAASPLVHFEIQKKRSSSIQSLKDSPRE